MESKIQREILDYLGSVPGMFVFKVEKANIRGIPDICGVYMGIPVFFEIKDPTGKLSEAQKIISDRIEICGGRVIVLRSVEDARKAVTPTCHFSQVKP